jgi:hypothetical protein
MLQPFLAFTFSFQPHSAHNMLVLMLESHFKNLQIIPDFVGLESTMEIVVKYGCTTCLLIMYNRWTLTLIRVEVANHVLLVLGVFGSLVST